MTPNPEPRIALDAGAQAAPPVASLCHGTARPPSPGRQREGRSLIEALAERESVRYADEHEDSWPEAWRAEIADVFAEELELAFEQAVGAAELRIAADWSLRERERAARLDERIRSLED